MEFLDKNELDLDCILLTPKKQTTEEKWAEAELKALGIVLLIALCGLGLILLFI